METFSNKYIDSFNILKHGVIGFEFEFYAERSFYRLLELLNRELAPIKTHGRRVYHSDFKPDEYNFKIEPDFSGGPNLVELITGPIPYMNAKIILLKILKLLQTNAKTDERCSIHINISFDTDKCDKDVSKVNNLKMILDIDEKMIYKYFPNRKNNFYAKSIKKLIPFKGFNFSKNAVNITTNNFQMTNDTKYYGVNLKETYNGRLEFRYIGGKDYQFKTKEIMELMDYFITLSWKSIDNTLTDENIDNLRSYLDDNINNFKNFTRLENFIAEFPTIQLEIDKNDNFIVIKSQYNQIQDKLYDIMRNVSNLSNCILNYDTNTNKIEIVDGDFETIFTLKNTDLVNCEIKNGEYIKCELQSTVIKNAHLTNCLLHDTEVFNCKMVNCDVDELSTIKESYYEGGTMNGNFESGTMRGGIVGQMGILGDKVKIITAEENYFGTFDDTNDEKKKVVKKLSIDGKI
jgi:hypothetical protein